MIPIWLIPLYTVLLGGTVALKKSMVARHIGKNPVILSGGTTCLEKIVKRGAVIFFPLWLGFLNYWNFKGAHPTFFISSKVISFVGLGLLFGSWVLFVISLIHLKNAWRFGIDRAQTNALITSGIYSKIRHPIYTSMMMAFSGAFLIFPSWVLLALLILGAAGAIHMASAEEKFLFSTFGEKYANYSQKTGRFLPR